MGIRHFVEWIAGVMTPIHATPSLDVAANRRHLRSGDLERVRSGLRHLEALVDRWGCVREARGELEALLTHDDAQITAAARELLAEL